MNNLDRLTELNPDFQFYNVAIKLERGWVWLAVPFRNIQG
jgi:hypothetical protein